MSSTRDFVAATVADTLLPVLRRPVEDVIYETIDRRQIPTRTDFTEIRDLVNSLRGQLTGATAGVKRLAESLDELDERIEALEGKAEVLDGLGEQLAAVARRAVAAEDAASEAREHARSAASTQKASAAALTAALERIAALEANAGAVAPSPAAQAAPPAPERAAAAPARDGNVCEIDGCERSVRAKNLCGRHYQQWRRGSLDGYPDPNA